MANWFQKLFDSCFPPLTPTYVIPICKFNSLPDELLLTIFRYVPIQDRVALRLVCRRWSSLSLTGIQELEFRSLLFDGKKDKNTNLNWTKIDPFLVVDLNEFPYPPHRPSMFFFIKKANKCLRRLDLVHEHGLCTSPYLCTTLVKGCPNITCLKISGYKIQIDDLHLLFHAYGHQLEELSLYRIESSNSSSCTFLIRFLITFGNPDRLRKLSIPIVCTQGLAALCNKFPHLTGFYARKACESTIVSEQHKTCKLNLFPLVKLKRLQYLTLHIDIQTDLKWIPVQDWKYSLIKLEFIDNKVQNFRSFFSFIHQLTALRRLKLWIKCQEELNFICCQLNCEMESFKVLLVNHDQKCFTFPDISRLYRLQKLRIYAQPTLRNLISFWNENITKLPSVRSLRLRGFAYQTMSEMDDFISNAYFIFPNLDDVQINC